MDEPRPDEDPEFVALLEETLPREWAQLCACGCTNGEELALAFVRASYGRGYVAALEGSAA